MDNEKQLLEEEEWFCKMMSIIAEQEGQRLLELNGRLRNDPAAQVPEKIDRSCRALIRMGVSGPRYRFWRLWRSARRWVRRMRGRTDHTS